ncbi:MAG: hypothetical protein CL521_02220 [Actinobacteria bacterium]|nr:hypothetical protein [Actinomycetota bacterium]|tara:strand:+ start:292 stop:624 length:333 start_codon:yes stop_codon:yes gene_type:complete
MSVQPIPGNLGFSIQKNSRPGKEQDTSKAGKKADTEAAKKETPSLVRELPEFEITSVKVTLPYDGGEQAEGCKDGACRACACNAGTELSNEAQPGDASFVRHNWNEIDRH